MNLYLLTTGEYDGHKILGIFTADQLEDQKRLAYAAGRVEDGILEVEGPYLLNQSVAPGRIIEGEVAVLAIDP